MDAQRRISDPPISRRSNCTSERPKSHTTLTPVKSTSDIPWLPSFSKPVKPDVFATLPPELMLPILVHLSPCAIIRLRRVSRLIKHLVETLITDHTAWSLLPPCFSPLADGSQQLSFTDFTVFTKRYTNMLRGRSVKVMMYEGIKDKTASHGTRATPATIEPGYFKHIIVLPGPGGGEDLLAWSDRGRLFFRKKGHNGPRGRNRQWKVNMGQVVKDYFYMGNVDIISLMIDADLGAILLIHYPNSRRAAFIGFHVGTGTCLWSLHRSFAHYDNPNPCPLMPDKVTDYLPVRAEILHPNTSLRLPIYALFLLHPATGVLIRSPLYRFEETPDFVPFPGYLYPKLRAYAISPCKLLAAGYYSFSPEEQDETGEGPGYGKSQIIIWEVVPGSSGSGILASYEWRTTEWAWARGFSHERDFIVSLFFSAGNEARPGARSGVFRTPDSTSSLALHEKRHLIARTRSVVSYNLTLLSSIDKDYHLPPGLGANPNPEIGRIKATAHTFALSTTFQRPPSTPTTTTTTKLTLKTYRTFKTPRVRPKSQSIIRLSPTIVDSGQHSVDGSGSSSNVGFPAWGLVANFSAKTERATMNIATFKVVNREFRDSLDGHDNLQVEQKQVEWLAYELDELHPLRLPPTIVTDENAAPESLEGVSSPAKNKQRAKAKEEPKSSLDADTEGKKKGREKDVGIVSRPVTNERSDPLGPQLEYKCCEIIFWSLKGGYYSLGGRSTLGGMRYVTGDNQVEIILPGCVLYF